MNVLNIVIALLATAFICFVLWRYVFSLNALLHRDGFKYVSVLLVLFSIVGGLLLPVPRMAILHETVRNLYYHVPMWFGMLGVLLASFVHGIAYLRGFRLENDIASAQAANIGTWLGALGLLTGMVWAQYTWGEWWSNDPKQTASAIGMLIYLAYFVLRGSIDDDDKRAKISAVYNIFAFCTLIPLLFVIPRIQDSLHPGSGGNPGFNAYDLDNRMRMVFYPAVVGWILLGGWLVSLKVRVELLFSKLS